MKLSQVKVKDLVVGALVIAAEAPSEERVYLDELESWTLTLITERGRRFWELHLTNADNVSRKHILVCFANETVPVMVAK